MAFLRRVYAKLRDFSSSSSKTVNGAAFVIAAAGILSRLLGFLRDRLLAGEFGAGDTLDAYYAAFRIPDLLYNLLVMGALSAAFVPVFTGLLSCGRKDEARRLAAGTLRLVGVTVGVLSVVAAVFAPQAVSLMAPGFSGGKRELTVVLTRLMLLSPVLLGISAVFGGVLISLKRFVAYSLAPILYNLGIIAGIFLFVPEFGPVGLGLGVVLGALLHMMVQVPALRGSGMFTVSSRGAFRADGPVRRVVALMIPRSLGMAANQAGLLLTTVFASSLASGSLAVFTLATNIQSIPIGLFAVSFSLAAFPVLSHSAIDRTNGDFFLTLSRTTRRILFFVVPTSMILIVFRAQVVRVILGSGRFDWEDTIATFSVLAWLSASLFAQALIPLFARAFYSLQDTKTPLFLALLAEVAHIALMPVLIPYFGVNALAIAFSVGSVINGLLLLFALRRRIDEWDDRRFFAENAKILLAALVAGLVAQISKSAFLLSPSPLDTFGEVLLQLVFGTAVGLGVFGTMSVALRIEEFHALKRFILAKVLRTPEAVSSVEGHPEKGEW